MPASKKLSLQQVRLIFFTTDKITRHLHKLYSPSQLILSISPKKNTGFFPDTAVGVSHTKGLPLGRPTNNTFQILLSYQKRGAPNLHSKLHSCIWKNRRTRIFFSPGDAESCYMEFTKEVSNFQHLAELEKFSPFFIPCIGSRATWASFGLVHVPCILYLNTTAVFTINASNLHLSSLWRASIGC
jgi:hypothetical protein